jgi:hypothetical protein
MTVWLVKHPSWGWAYYNRPQYKFCHTFPYFVKASMSEDHLAITEKNRHQYLKTVMYSASASEGKIMRAEARGRARQEREEALQRKLWLLLRVALVLVACGAAIAGTLYLRQMQ